MRDDRVGLHPDVRCSLERGTELEDAFSRKFQSSGRTPSRPRTVAPVRHGNPHIGHAHLRREEGGFRSVLALPPCFICGITPRASFGSPDRLTDPHMLAEHERSRPVWFHLAFGSLLGSTCLISMRVRSATGPDLFDFVGFSDHNWTALIRSRRQFESTLFVSTLFELNRDSTRAPRLRSGSCLS